MSEIEYARRARVSRQQTAIPAIYGNIDFDLTPERWNLDLGSSDPIGPGFEQYRIALRDDPGCIEMIKAYTMLGDEVSDAYASLIPEHGFLKLTKMLAEACDHGAGNVEGAPPELDRFIASMEDRPAWVDMSLVEEGARIERNATVHFAPFAIRGGLFATFINKYAALPMALTGALSHQMAARRVKETAVFFAVTVAPHALERHGPGFKAAAMVRLMHSMVRFNLLSRGQWDQKTYGIPIPQVDQMPAGLISAFLMASKAHKEGRKEFSAAERALVELGRYRCFLLGLPQELLADTPEGIIKLWMARQASLQPGFDDATCGQLLRATMAADLAPDTRFASRLAQNFERSFSKLFFLRNFVGNDSARAASMGIGITATDRLKALVVAAVIGVNILRFEAGRRIPGIGSLVERRLITKLSRRLDRLGHADFTTDAAHYRPAV